MNFWEWLIAWGTSFVGWLRSANPVNSSSGGSGGNSVPELSMTVGPLAVAIIFCMIAIAFEYRRQKLLKE